MKVKFGSWWNHLTLLLLITLAIATTQAQGEEMPEQRKNTVKLDITSLFLYRSAKIFSFERVTKPNQSFSITAGYQEFPRLIGLGDKIKSTKYFNRSGLKVGAEYRFYLAKENKI